MTEPLLTQVEVEERMYAGGILRAQGMMDKAEENGRAHQNPYAKELFREYVLPLSAAIREELDLARPGRRQAHASLLWGLDYDAVAYLSVRTVIGSLMRGDKERPHHRTLAYEVGRTIHNELVLNQIADFNPALYNTLTKDFQRRLSKDERHRMTVFRRQAQVAGIIIHEWPMGARDQVGMYILGLLEVAGMIVIGPAKIVRGKTEYRSVDLDHSILERIDQVKDYVAMTMPVYGPCVQPPRDWTTPTDGGFYTKELRRTCNLVVRSGATLRPIYQNANMPLVLKAVNALQRTAWQVNTEVLDTVLEVARHYHTKEIVSLADDPKPSQPPWLSRDTDPEKLEQWQKDEFKGWKRSMTQWYEKRKLNGTRYGRFYSATRSAEMFRGYPAIYFVYFADSRGRLYPMTYGMNPQGSDLQKALLRFSVGKPVSTPAAIRWFHVQGANKWGFDKATLAERQAWVVEHQDQILAMAADPVNNREWTQAGDPLQFLAWAFEYKRWVEDRDGSFLSHLPISMDGSCNGLQNLSALLRDEVGGRATNLTANSVMEDIYRRVAEATVVRLQAQRYEGDKERLRLLWLEHGVSRSVVKRSVMTTPYGVTRRSAIDYVISDYLADDFNQAPFRKEDWRAAATVLMDSAWPAIGDVVVKGREAMAWLKGCAAPILKRVKLDEELVISWRTPSGFPAAQCYYETEAHDIRTRLHGPAQIKILTETEDADVSRHASGLAPNFVHSMDAAHLHLTTAEACSRGIDALAMIHDDYGTHAADAEELYRIIREQFVRMYEEHDPIADFKAKYPMVAEPPAKGSLDIREVLDSPFFFS
jgi:DNA-directed RNA polymerase